MPSHADLHLCAEILENLAEGVLLTCMQDGRILFVNRWLAEMLGYKPHELRGQPMQLVQSPVGDDVGRASAQEVVECLRRDGVWRGEWQCRRKDGTVVWCDVKISAFQHDQHGTVWMALHRTISSGKRVEGDCAEREQRLSQIMAATGRGGWEWNIRTGEIQVSRYWLSSLGYSADDFSPHVTFWENLLHPEDKPRIYRAMEDHFAGRAPLYESVNRLRMKDGTWRWTFDCGRVVEWSDKGDPLRMVGIDADLTDHKWFGVRGIIPICASCKNIRDQHGAWHPLERYFGDHIPAKFSHGLCQPCMEEIAGDMSRTVNCHGGEKSGRPPYEG